MSGDPIKYIGLLRGVNVGGHRKLPMSELGATVEAAGYRGVRTLLASGNFVFEARRTKSAALEKKLEGLLAKKLGLETDIMVRDPEEWDAIIDANPFGREAKSNPAKLLLVVLKSEPSAADVKKTIDANKGPERLKVIGREVYVFYPNGVGVSKLNLKPLGSGTGRNWNTVLKLQAMTAEKA